MKGSNREEGGRMIPVGSIDLLSKSGPLPLDKPGCGSVGEEMLLSDFGSDQCWQRVLKRLMNRAALWNPCEV